MPVLVLSPQLNPQVLDWSVSASCTIGSVASSILFAAFHLGVVATASPTSAPRLTQLNMSLFDELSVSCSGLLISGWLEADGYLHREQTVSVP